MKNANAKVANELLRLARQLAAQPDDAEDEIVDEAFVTKLRDLRTGLLKLSNRKNMHLSKFGIGMIRPNSKVIDLVDALLRVAAAG